MKYIAKWIIIEIIAMVTYKHSTLIILALGGWGLLVFNIKFY